MEPWRKSDLFQYAFTFERAVVTPYTFSTVFVPAYISLYVMAVLVQLPRTNFYRVALLPVVFWLNFRAAVSLDFSWNHPAYAYMNHGVYATLFSIAMRSTAWAFTQQPYSRFPNCRLGDGAIDDKKNNTSTEHDVSVASAMWDALDLVANPRGVGWNGPPKMTIATPYFQVKSRSMFALLSFCQFIFLALALDISCVSIHSLGAQSFATPEGGTIFDPSLPSLQRYLKSSTITLLVGIAAYVCIDVIYQLQTTLVTILCKHHPSQWPPLFDSPWLSTSLSGFWGRRWHQLHREFFVGLGGKLTERHLGRVGAIMGAFAISGVLHVVAVWGMRRGVDTLPVMGFFLMQGVGVVTEYAWKRATGRLVGGFIGWLWTFFWLLSWGNIIVDAWARSGLFGSEVGIIGDLRPSTLFLNWMSPQDELL